MDKENEITVIHDYCLDYELEILSAVESLIERRVSAENRKSVDDLKKMIPLLNVIIDEANCYKLYLEEGI